MNYVKRNLETAVLSFLGLVNAGGVTEHKLQTRMSESLFLSRTEAVI